MSRTGRIARALTVGYGYQAVVMVVGLWLTPLFVAYLGITDYGRWLVIGQVLGYLGLLDLGVTAMLPREVAAAAGAADRSARLPEVVRPAVWLVWLQTPVVAVAAAVAWAGVVASRPELARPLAVVLAAYTALFPLRVFTAVLNGLQDLTFAGGAQAAGWAVTTAISAGMAVAGWGLYSLAVGWAAGQAVTAAAGWWRVRRKFPEARPRGGRPSRARLWQYFRASLWVSLRQLAMLLAGGCDLIILGLVAGPAEVVVYSCTGKLISFVNNLPLLIALNSIPALGELRAAGAGDRLERACRAVGLAVLLLSGLAGVVVVAANPAFVTRWMGAGFYAGPTVNWLIVAAMLTRHYVFILVSVTYVHGHDRWLAITSMADGVVTAAAMLAWATAFGAVGIPLGSITGSVLTNGLAGVYTLARDFRTSPAQILGWLAPWTVRLVAIGGPAVAATYLLPVQEWPVGAGATATVAAVYALAAWPLLTSGVLRDYWDRLTAPIRRMVRPAAPGSPASAPEADYAATASAPFTGGKLLPPGPGHPPNVPD